MSLWSSSSVTDRVQVKYWTGYDPSAAQAVRKRRSGVEVSRQVYIKSFPTAGRSERNFKGPGPPEVVTWWQTWSTLHRGMRKDWFYAIWSDAWGTTRSFWRHDDLGSPDTACSQFLNGSPCVRGWGWLSELANPACFSTAYSQSSSWKEMLWAWCGFCQLTRRFLHCKLTRRFMHCIHSSKTIVVFRADGNAVIGTGLHLNSHLSAAFEAKKLPAVPHASSCAACRCLLENHYVGWGADMWGWRFICIVCSTKAAFTLFHTNSRPQNICNLSAASCLWLEFEHEKHSEWKHKPQIALWRQRLEAFHCL